MNLFISTVYYVIVNPFVIRRRDNILSRVASTCMLLIKELLKCYRVFEVL